jgi:hypothetical protein
MATNVGVPIVRLPDGPSKGPKATSSTSSSLPPTGCR